MRSFCFLIVSLSFICSCSRISENREQFELNFSTDVTLPSSEGEVKSISITSEDISPNLESELFKRNSSVGLIRDFELVSITMTITNPDTLDYIFLREIGMYAVDDNIEMLIGSTANIPDAIGNILELEITDADVLDYFREENFNIKLVGVLSNGTTVDIFNRIDLVVSVTAGSI